MLMQLISQIFLFWRRQLQKAILSESITLKQYYVLQYLEINHVCSPSTISEILYCDRPTATVILKNLEKKSFIVNKKSHANRKHHIISITDKGKEKADNIKNLMLSRITINPFSCLDKQEKQLLKNLLSKIYNNLISYFNSN